jgi:Mce-associated membrane protein
VIGLARLKQHADDAPEEIDTPTSEPTLEPEAHAVGHIDEAVVVGEASATAGNESKNDEESAEAKASENKPPVRRIRVTRGRQLLVFAAVPALAMLLAVGAGILRWQVFLAQATQAARVQSVQAATDSTVKILSYSPDTADKELPAARDLLTGTFRDAYTELTNGVVIPGAKQKNISAVANVPAVASVSATQNHAVVLVFVNQTITVGNEAPTSTASSVRVTLDKVHDRWLISQFDPV